MDLNNVDVAKLNPNSYYAPGVATYGMEGKKGDAGLSGNFVYLTDMSKSELEVAISNGLLPMKGKNERLPVNRKYAENDIFIMYTGIIYKLNSLMILTQCGKIDTNANNIYMNSNNDTVLNTAKGLVIDVTDYGAYKNSDGAALQIYNNKYNDDLIQFIKLFGIDNNITLKLNIYYDINTDSFYFNSDKPIIFNNGILTNEMNYESIDDTYYPVITYKDTKYMSISKFNLIALKVKYDIKDSKVNNDDNTYIILHVGDNPDNLAKIAKSYIITGDNLDSIHDEVYLKLYLTTNETYLFPLRDCIYTASKNIKIPLKKEKSNKDAATNYNISSDTIVMASLMYNTEIVIKNESCSDSV